jgi:hypothetical protein
MGGSKQQEDKEGRQASLHSSDIPHFVMLSLLKHLEDVIGFG